MALRKIKLNDYTEILCETKADLQRVKADWKTQDSIRDKVAEKIRFGLDEKKDDPDVVRQVRDIAFREEMMKQPLVHYEQIDQAIKDWK